MNRTSPFEHPEWSSARALHDSEASSAKGDNEQNSIAMVGRVGFAVGTGRCGTTFLSHAAGREDAVASSHCRDPLLETFHRYCQWYRLPVDHEGFLHGMQQHIQADLEKRSYSFECSSYLSLSILELYERFAARFVLLVREPAKVVHSYLVKGWYEREFVCADPNLALGYQPCAQFHHFLGRIAPMGDDFARWNRLTRVGKIAWHWAAINRAVLDQFQQIPNSHWKVQRLDELDHAAYCQLARFLGFEATLAERDFKALVRQKPNSRPSATSPADWSDTEANEFEAEVAEVARDLGYEYHADAVRTRVTRAAQTPAQRLRRELSAFLGGRS